MPTVLARQVWTPLEDWGSAEPRQRLNSLSADVSILAMPIILKNGCKTKNRFMKSGMSERMGKFDAGTIKDRGLPSSRLIRLYEKFGFGDYGVIVTGNISIHPETLEAPGNVVISKHIDSEERRKIFKEWTTTTKKNGSLFLAQIAHPGNQAHILSSTKKVDMNTMATIEVRKIIEDFIWAANYAYTVDFDGVELSGAYFYALGHLLHGEVNTRKDEYGGSLENRTRAIFELVHGIRKLVPPRFVIGLKLTSLNFEPNYNEKDFLTFVKRLEDSTIDYITIAGGHFNILKDMSQLERKSSVKRENFYQTVVCAMNKVLKKTPLYMNGGFVTLADMVEAIKGNWTTGIAIARPAAQEPDLPKKILGKKALAAVKSLIDVNDFMTSITAGGTQLWQHGGDETVMDNSNTTHVEAFKRALEACTKAAKEHPDKILVGYPTPQITD